MEMDDFPEAPWATCLPLLINFWVWERARLVSALTVFASNSLEFPVAGVASLRIELPPPGIAPY